ncbi:MAG: MFS transporter [Cytophagales bacterium]|nr:MFS transporter [Cytophagales bacterium]
MSKLKDAVKQFPKTFWIANTMELFERWAWYGLFAVLAIYLTGSTETGALGFSQSEKGYIMGPITAILYLLPTITGTLADKFGYKKTLIVAYTIMAISYFLLGQVTGFFAFWGFFLLLAVGAALFKPVISATIAKTTNKDNSSIGFGLFYMMVNVGGFVGPAVAAKMRAISWDYVFYVSTAAAILNLILVMFFYKEPDRKKSDEPLAEAIANSMRNIVEGLSDIKLVVLLFLIIGFWTMFNQIFYTLPNFIEQWVDTSSLYNALYNISPVLADFFGNDKGHIPQEMMINVDAGSIVLFQVIVSAIVMRFRPLNAMMGGIFVCAIGVGLAFYTMNPFYVLAGIFIFSLGEMSSSPKFTEYIGGIAPKGKEGLYMGLSYLPVAAGNLIAGIISGAVYEDLGDKVTLAKRMAAENGLNIPKVTKEFTQTDYYNEMAKQMGNITQQDLTIQLWEAYNPQQIWMIFVAIGLVTIIGLFAYDRLLLQKHETIK